MPRSFLWVHENRTKCLRPIRAFAIFLLPMLEAARLIDRLRASASLWFDDGIVIDPDSRLTQLGLISVCDEKDYFFFESRSYGGEGNDPLSALASRWAHEVFGVESALPFVAPLPSADAPADITVSLGVGENPSKRIDGDFELRSLTCVSGNRRIDPGRQRRQRRGARPSRARRAPGNAHS